MEKIQERRKNYYIGKEFQRNFILKFCILVIIGSLISGGIIYGMAKTTVTTTFENSRLTIRSTADYILPSVLLSGAIVIMLIGAATIFITLFTSHRIAGPLYRMEKDVGEVASGNLNVMFNLRFTDELKPLALSLHNMTQTLKEHVLKVKDIVNEMEASAGSAEVKDEIKKLKSEIEKFKT